MMREGGTTPADRIDFGFELATARKPRQARSGNPALESSATIAIYSKAIRRQRNKYLSQGEAPRDEKLDARELAAYSAVASTILNLDIAVTKE